MNLKLKRRRFGLLALASATTTLLSNFAAKTVAQQARLVIYGVRLTPASSSITEDQADASAANKTPAIILQSIDLVTGQDVTTAEILEQIAQNQQEPTQTVNKALVVKKPSERITGFTALSDGTFVVAAAAATKKGDFSRFIFFGQDITKPKKGLKSKNLKKNNTVESLLSIQNGQLLSIVSQNQGQPPFELALINSRSGQVDSGTTLGLPYLLPNQRFSNLAQSPDGKIYATTLDSEGVPILVQLDLQSKSPITGRGKISTLVKLSFNNSPLKNDLASLTFSPSNQLFALADPQSEGTNSLFTVDLKTGEMKLLRKFAVDKIAFSRV